ncbi:hypothetical protein ABZS66_48415, partial [Dactylosporangium sp. NPDC005572]
MIVAWVDGEPIGRDEADAQLRERYRAPGGHALPAPGTAEGRQLRRWVVQVLAVRAVLAHEADRRGLTASGAAPVTDRVALGSVAAAALAGSPYAAAVFDAVARVDLRRGHGGPAGHRV